MACVFEHCFIEQALARVGVVVSAIERLLKTPVAQQRLAARRAPSSWNCCERRVDARVGRQRTAPVPLQRQQALRELLARTRRR